MFNKTNLMTILAIIVISVGVVSSAYTQLSYKTTKEITKDVIIVDGKQLNFNELYEKLEHKTIQAEKKGVIKNYTGVSLGGIIIEAGVENPGQHQYKITGTDGYSPASPVSWGDMQTGIITEDRDCVFPNLPGSFWVRDLASIEVI